MTTPQITITLDALERWTLRIGLIVGAVALWGAASQLFDNSNIGQNQNFLIIVMLLVLAGLFMLVAATSRRTYPVYHLVIIASFASLFLVYGLYYSVNRSYQSLFPTTDVFMFTDYSAALVRRGINPYSMDLADSYRIYRTSLLFNTPTVDGDFVAKLVYPPLSFLPFIAFQAISIPTELVYPFFQFLLVLVLFRAAPAFARPLVIIPMLVDSRFIWNAFGGVNDSIWALFIVLTIVLWRRTPWNAICFGLACATKQQTWLLIPFVAVLLWHESGAGGWRTRAKPLIRFATVSFIVFLIINLPFFIWDPAAWLRGVTSPFTDQMITLGMGIASVVTYGGEVIPRGVFTLSMGLVYSILLVTYMRFGQSLKHAVWVFPALILWFGQRSLSSYWYYNVFPAAAVVFVLLSIELTHPASTDNVIDAPSPARSRFNKLVRSPVATVFVLFLATSTVIAGFASSLGGPPAMSIRVEYPIQTQGNVDELVVSVTNNSGQPIQPHFAVQVWNGQPNQWVIEDGPHEIATSANAVFRLRADMPYKTFGYATGAQVTVTDRLNEDLRASTSVSPDTAWNSLDGFRNGQFAYWWNGIPVDWGVISDNSHDSAVSYIETPEQAGAVELTVSPAAVPANQGELASTRLDTWIHFPDYQLEVTVNVPDEANRLPALAVLYGLELLSTFDGESVWVLFGEEDKVGILDDGQRYRMIATPRGEWVTLTLDVAETFALAGVVPAAPQFLETFRADLTFPKRMLNFHLLLAGRNLTQPVHAWFGPVRVVADGRDTLIDYSVTHPEEISLLRGELSFRAGNLTAARQYVNQALALAPNNPNAQYWLGRIALADGDPESAASYFTLARQNEYVRHSALSYAEAETRVALGRYDEARTLIEQAINELDQQPYFYTSTDRAEQYALLGWIAGFQGQYRIAEAAFTSALAQESHADKAQLGAGIVQMLGGDVETGRITLEGVSNLSATEVTQRITSLLAALSRCDLAPSAADALGIVLVASADHCASAQSSSGSAS